MILGFRFYFPNAVSVFDRNDSTDSLMSISIRSARTVSRQMHSPNLWESSGFVFPFGQRPCCDMVWRPTNPASVRKAKASSSTVHSLPWCSFSNWWYCFLICKALCLISARSKFFIFHLFGFMNGMSIILFGILIYGPVLDFWMG